MNTENKWDIDKLEIGYMKLFCIHGFRISHTIPLALRYQDDVIKITFIPFKEFNINYEPKDFINNNDLVECDTVGIIRTCNNNTLEIQLLKISVSALYFAERYKQSQLRIKFHDSTSLDDWHDYFTNYLLFDGYRTCDGIYSASWYVNIGRHPLDEDDFERWVIGVYGNCLHDFYNRKSHIPPNGIPFIDFDDLLLNSLSDIVRKINSDCEYGKKLKSALRLYYEVLCDFKNIDYTIITYCTIFETLLLKNDEDSQRKKVAARAACITCDTLKFQYKNFVANQVYHFYKYRNAIIHDGKGILDFEDETLFNHTLYGIKNIIFCIIKKIVNQNINSHSDLMNIIRSNLCDDGLKNGFEYISLDKFKDPDYNMQLNIN